MVNFADPYPHDKSPSPKDCDDAAEFAQRQEEFYEELISEQPSSPEEGVVGAILRFPSAAGYAFYRVVEEDPLTVQQLPIGNAFRDSGIYEVELEDVKRGLRNREEGEPIREEDW